MDLEVGLVAMYLFANIIIGVMINDTGDEIGNKTFIKMLEHHNTMTFFLILFSQITKTYMKRHLFFSILAIENTLYSWYKLHKENSKYTRIIVLMNINMFLFGNLIIYLMNAK